MNSNFPDPWLDCVTSPERIYSGFSSEAHIARDLKAYLQAQGVLCESEVVCGMSSTIRADLVTPYAVIELKKTLDRSALYQAKGQAETYAALLGKQRVWIVGEPPSNTTEELQARRIAKDISRTGCRVAFVDGTSNWMQEIASDLKTFRPTVVGSRAIANNPDFSEVLDAIQSSDNLERSVKSAVTDAHDKIINAIEQSAKYSEQCFQMIHTNQSQQALQRVFKSVEELKGTGFPDVYFKPKTSVLSNTAIAIGGWLLGIATFVGASSVMSGIPDRGIQPIDRELVNKAVISCQTSFDDVCRARIDDLDQELFRTLSIEKQDEVLNHDKLSDPDS